MDIERVLRLRRAIEAASVHLSDEAAVEVPELFPAWQPDGRYEVGDRVRYGGKLYKVLLAHDGQATWTPKDAPSLFGEVLAVEGVVAEWVQPGSTNAYMRGDKVTHGGQTWVSTCDNNVWEPGVYGWEAME